MNSIIESQPQAIEDYGKGRIQLKIDLIEREAYLKCLEIMDKHANNKSE